MAMKARSNTRRTQFTHRLSYKKGLDVASAAVPTLGSDGNIFDITGTTTITHLNPTDWDPGAVIVLQFDGALTLTHNSGSDSATQASLLLRGGQNVVTVAGDRIAFYFDGTNFIEISRAASGAQRQQARFEFAKGADVASAGTVTLGADGNYFHITGTTTINYITVTNWQAGSVIILKFGGSLTVTHNAGSVPANTAAILLAGAANLSATADDTLTLVYDGTTWREVARTVI